MGTLEQIKQSNAEDVREPHSSKFEVVFGVAFTALMLTVYAIYAYFLSPPFRGAGWRWFWGSGVFMGLLLIYVGLYPRSSSTILRKRIIGSFVVVFTAIMLGAYIYHRSTYLGNTDWPSFWIGEAIVGAWFVFGIVQVRKTPRL